MSKLREVLRARRAAGKAYLVEANEGEGLGSVTISPKKTRAEIIDELNAAGVTFDKKARRDDLEALLPGNTTPDLGAVVAEDIEEEKPS
jgi:hypothetical protein